MNKHKVISFIMAIVIASVLILPASTEEVTAIDKGQDAIDYVDLLRISTNLSINGTTATCMGRAMTATSSNTVRLKMYLQCKSGNTWYTVANWAVSGLGGNYVTLLKAKTGLSFGFYRIYLYVAVYDANGALVESTSIYSNIEYVG